MSVVFDNDTSWSDPWPRPKSGQAKGKTSLFLFLFPPVFHLPVQFLDRPPWSTTGYCSNKTQLQPTYVKCDAGSVIEVTGGNIGKQETMRQVISFSTGARSSTIRVWFVPPQFAFSQALSSSCPPGAYPSCSWGKEDHRSWERGCQPNKLKDVIIVSGFIAILLCKQFFTLYCEGYFISLVDLFSFLFLYDYF